MPDITDQEREAMHRMYGGIMDAIKANMLPSPPADNEKVIFSTLGSVISSFLTFHYEKPDAHRLLDALTASAHGMIDRGNPGTRN